MQISRPAGNSPPPHLGDRPQKIPRWVSEERF